MRRAAKVDATQAEIIKALRRVGCAVEVIGQPLDLLVCGGQPKRTLLMDCKSPRPTSEGGAHGKTKAQQEFVERWPGELHFVKTPEEAIAAALGKDALR